MRKQLIMLLLAFAAAMQASAATTFNVSTPNGTLKYTVTNATTHEVSVEAATKTNLKSADITKWKEILHLTNLNFLEELALYAAKWADIKGDLVIPETVEHNGVTYTVTSIAAQGFQGCVNPTGTTQVGLTSVKLPSTLTSIGESAFESCPLLSGELVIPGSVASVSNKAFNHCQGVTTLILEEGVTSVGDYAFDNISALQTAQLPSTLTSVGLCGFRCILDGINTNAVFTFCGTTPPTCATGSKNTDQPFLRKTPYYETNPPAGSNTQYPPTLKLYWPATTINCASFPISAKTDAGHHLSIKDYGYATMCWGEKALQLPAGLTACTYHAAADGTLTTGVSYAAGAVIPAGTAVLVSGPYDKNGYNIDFATDPDNPGTADLDNALHGTDAQETPAVQGDVCCYMLSLNSAGASGSEGFYWGAANGAPFQNGAHKAYLVVPKGTQPTAFYSLRGNGGTTGIAAPQTAAATKQAAYNLQGQRVGDDYKGIVIVGGRKVLRK